MKAVYYYSPTQESISVSLKMYDRNIPRIGGMKYTEICHFEDDDYVPPKNKWPDSHIVTIRYGLDVEIGPLGRRYAKLN